MTPNSSLERVLAARIRRARKDMPHQNGKAVSQATFAERLGVHWVTVSNWERGKGVPSIENLVAIAEATGKPVTFFTDDDDEEDEEALRRIVLMLLDRREDTIAAVLLERVQKMGARREARA